MSSIANCDVGPNGLYQRADAMFEREKLLGSTERSIVVQTHLGHSIRNVIGPPVGEYDRRQFELLVARYGRYWERRKPPVGVYNCAGHVWASRRTAIYDETEWRVVLRDDGYRRVQLTELPLPEDLAVYIDSTNGEVLHVGRIVVMRPGLAEGSPPIPWVVSKWKDTSGEVVHNVHDVPYAGQGFSVSIEYWTDRPSAIPG